MVKKKDDTHLAEYNAFARVHNLGVAYFDIPFGLKEELEKVDALVAAIKNEEKRGILIDALSRFKESAFVAQKQAREDLTKSLDAVKSKFIRSILL